MKQVFSHAWKASTNPAKQRKYVANAPLHVRSGMLGCSLSKELRVKYHIRTLRVRVGDTVKLMRGSYKGTIGKVDRVDIGRQRIFVEKAELTKKDGSKVKYPIHPSNAMIIELNLDDKRRKAKLTVKDKPKGEKA